MNASGCKELFFLLDSNGAIIAYQEKEQSWAGALAFSSEELAWKFLEMSRLDAAEIVAVDADDAENLGELVVMLKRRPIRYLLLDLDYQSGKCGQVDFEHNGLGTVRERQFAAAHHHA